MGMTIDDIEQWARQNNYTIVSDNWWKAAQDTINNYQQLQADYENRLKADMVAMFKELKAEIEELNMHGSIQLQSYRQRTGRYRQGFERAQNLSTKIIQQKIDKLKEQNNE